MTEWIPPKADGLTGDAYPSEQIEAFVDDLGDARVSGVYALTCSQPERFKTAADRFQDAFDAPAPGWLTAGYAAENALYVGAARDVLGRIEDHAAGRKTAAFLQVFPPHSIWDVWLIDDVDRAFERESMIATELNNVTDVYAHQR